ncbi:HTH-type transcriptional regulator CysB [invertebrate metagenome]|uniref:HTH-type transcriptional regulator CysB n=1 Tax=invertebrate metagenome TaxID=1711999 RepID=A0A2H9TC54_9ZZZZ
MQCGTATAAAQVLNISQPAVTRLLHTLEDQAGFALFERTGGRLVPTREGDAFFYEVNKSFIELEQLESCMKAIKERPVGILHIASMPMLSLCFIPDVLGSMSLRCSQTMLRNYRSEKVLQILEVGGCDIGFAILDSEDHLHGECLRVDCEMCCLLPPKSPLKNKSCITTKNLSGLPVIGYEHAEPQERIRNVFHKTHVTYKPVAEASFAMSIGSMVAAGIGYGIVDPFTAIHFSKLNIVFKPFHPEISSHFDILLPSEKVVPSSAYQFLHAFFHKMDNEGICYHLSSRSCHPLIRQLIRRVDKCNSEYK